MSEKFLISKNLPQENRATAEQLQEQFASIRDKDPKNAEKLIRKILDGMLADAQQTNPNEFAIASAQLGTKSKS